MHKVRYFAIIAAAAIIAMPLAACSTSSGSGGGQTSSGSGSSDASTAKIAFLMPDHGSTRYESQDRPLFEAKIKQLCPNCVVVYSNADTDASKQQQQAESALAQGVKAMVIDPVDTTAAASIVKLAHAQNVPVIAYDRPIPNGNADYYVSFDNEKLGAQFAQSLVDHLKKIGATGGLLMVNGAPTDAAAMLIKKGAHSAVDPSGFPVLAEFDTPDWKPSNAQDWVSGQIAQFGSKIVGVVAANDGTGGGTISAFKAAGVNPVPPVTGNDAEIAAAQRIVSGDQFNTISKPIKIVAEASADVAWAFAQGKKPASSTTLYDTPSQLFVPEVVTIDNLKAILVDSGIMTVAQICTTEYATACKAHGIS
jgi:D-xylose transport system substrate-binding protein